MADLERPVGWYSVPAGGVRQHPVPDRCGTVMWIASGCDSGQRFPHGRASPSRLMRQPEMMEVAERVSAEPRVRYCSLTSASGLFPPVIAAHSLRTRPLLLLDVRLNPA